MKRRNSRMTLATALAASTMALAACGGGDDNTATTPAPAPAPAPSPSPSPAPTPAPAPSPSPSPNPAPAPAPSPNPSTIALNSTYPANTGTCSQGVSTVAQPDSTNVTWSYAEPVVTFVDGATTVTMTYAAGTVAEPNPVGTDDQATNPLSATYNGTATNGPGDPFTVTLSISADGQLLGAGYNPNPTSSSPSQAELDAVDAATVLCGSLALPDPRP